MRSTRSCNPRALRTQARASYGRRETSFGLEVVNRQTASQSPKRSTRCRHPRGQARLPRRMRATVHTCEKHAFNLQMHQTIYYE